MLFGNAFIMSDESMGRMSGQSLFRLFSFMRHLLIIGCLCFAAIEVLESQDSKDLVIVDRSDHRTVFEFRPRYMITGTTNGQKSATAPVLEQGIAPPGPMGAPLLSYRGLKVSLHGPRVLVRVLESNFRDRNDIRPLPRPGFVADPAFGASREFGTLEKQGVMGFAPAEIAVVTDIARAGAGYEGTLKLFPLQFDESRNIVRQYDRIVVAVESVPDPLPYRILKRASNPLAQGEWYRLEVEETGMIKLDQAFFSSAGINLASLLDIQSIRIFGNGGRSLPEDLLLPRPAGLEEIARMIIDQDNDGVFDPEDFVVFYGASPHSWRYNAISKNYSHVTNHYSDRNAYFLTFGGTAGRGMNTFASTSTPGAPVAANVRGMQVHEEELYNLLNSGRQWYGRLFDTDSPTATIATTLAGIESSAPVSYRIAVLGRTGTTASFSIHEGVDLLSSITILPVNLPSIETEYAYAAPVATFTRTGGSIADNRSLLRLTYQSAGGQGWLDWFEIHYRRSPQAANDFIQFPTEDTTAVMEYHLSGFSSAGIMVFDVSDHDSVVQITNLSPNPADPGACVFQVPLTAGAPRWLAAVGQNGFKTPVSVNRIGNSDVRGITEGAEFVIVAPKEFQSEADRLRSHRQQNDSLSTIVVNIEDLTNEYAGGLTDPMAVRDFLADAVQSWAVPPKYALLLGDAHYDYKNRKTNDRNWIPPYESLESLHQINTFASDDPMAMLFPGNPRVSLAVGRLPVNSVEEARRVVDKIIGYETTAPFGDWRNRATFVADDGLTSTRDDGSIHTFQAEVVAQTYTPAQMQKKKIYLIEYPTVNSSSGRRKPAVNNAIIDAINGGTALLNYTGHGNPQLWAHEAVFTREGSVAQLRNGTQLFLLIAATCDFARYDDPSEVSTGELLLTMGNGGAIGVVTATRAVYSSDNFQFNNTFSTELFRRDSLGVPPRIGEALRLTKQIHYDLNDLKYHLLGDPTVRLNLPRNTAGVDSLNGYSLNSLAQIQALGKIDIAGEIRRQNGTRWSDFHGQALLEMEDARRTVFVPEWNFSFVVNGSLLYRGDISVTAGLFQARIPVPKDVSYDSSRARISVYAWTPSADAAGFSENIIIAGTDSSAVPDTTGPGIDIFLNDESFRPGDVVSPDPELIVRLFDENGINTSMASVGHGLEARLSGTGETMNLSQHYRGEKDTFQSGTVRLQLQGLPEGKQTLEVRAWDTYNNSSRNEIPFDVRAVSDLRLYQVYNFPNPVSRSTVFTFQRTSTEPIDVRLKVYTTAGRLVMELNVPSVIERFVRIPWDGRDQNGDQLANGVYFYKIITRTPSGSQSEEALGKLTMLR